MPLPSCETQRVSDSKAQQGGPEIRKYEGNLFVWLLSLFLLGVPVDAADGGVETDRHTRPFSARTPVTEAREKACVASRRCVRLRLG